MLFDYLLIKGSLIKEYPAISRRFLGRQYFFSSVEIKTAYNSVKGFGVAGSPHTSNKKAFYESVEWSALSSSKALYNGSAAGVAWQKVHERALLEAYERDTFIRWYVGQLSPYKISDYDTVTYKFISSSLSGILCVALLREGYKCIPFGLGFGKTEQQAKQKAENELVMSLFRHARIPCEHIHSNYNQLHQLTTIPEVRKRLLDGTELHEQPAAVIRSGKAPSSYKLIGAHRWPIIVCAVADKDLLMWDLDEFRKPIKQSKFISIVSKKAPLSYGIPTG